MKTDDMPNDRESMLRQLLKNVVREVAAEFMDEWKAAVSLSVRLRLPDRGHEA